MNVSIFPLKTTSRIAALDVASALTVKPCIFKLSGPTAHTNAHQTFLLGQEIFMFGFTTMKSPAPQRPIRGKIYPEQLNHLYPPPLSCVHPHYLHIFHTRI